MTDDKPGSTPRTATSADIAKRLRAIYGIGARFASIGRTQLQDYEYNSLIEAAEHIEQLERELDTRPDHSELQAALAEITQLRKEIAEITRLHKDLASLSDGSYRS